MMLQCDWIETGKTFLAIVCKGFLALCVCVCMFGVGGGVEGWGGRHDADQSRQGILEHSTQMK